jgi:hypothetical protein
MRRATPTLPAICAIALAVMLVGTALGASDRNTLLPLPHWLVAAEKGALDRVFGGATPIHTYYISYPKKIAVIFEFKGVVICRTCSGPSRATQPRGRVIRVSFDRQTHQLNGPMQFCESRGALPRRALCLRR